MVAERGGPRIEWRRYRQQGGANVVQERFPIRLSWIPFLVEGLIRAEDSLRELEMGAGVMVFEEAQPSFDGTALVILPEKLAQSGEATVVSPSESEDAADPSLRTSGRFPRFLIRAPLIVAVQGKELAGPRILTGDAIDISWGGLQALLPSRLTPGTVLEILMGLGGKRALKLPARVVWGRLSESREQAKPHGLEFLPADPRLRQLVEQFILQLAQGPR
jgi:hypothetical protein